MVSFTQCNASTMNNKIYDLSVHVAAIIFNQESFDVNSIFKTLALNLTARFTSPSYNTLVTHVVA